MSKTQKFFNNKTITKGIACTKLAKWFKEIYCSDFKAFNIVANSISCKLQIKTQLF